MRRPLKVGFPRTGRPRTTCGRWRREEGCPASVGAVGALSQLVMNQKSAEIIPTRFIHARVVVTFSPQAHAQAPESRLFPERDTRNRCFGCHRELLRLHVRLSGAPARVRVRFGAGGLLHEVEQDHWLLNRLSLDLLPDYYVSRLDLVLLDPDAPAACAGPSSWRARRPPRRGHERGCPR